MAGASTKRARAHSTPQAQAVEWLAAFKAGEEASDVQQRSTVGSRRESAADSYPRWLRLVSSDSEVIALGFKFTAKPFKGSLWTIEQSCEKRKDNAQNMHGAILRELRRVAMPAYHHLLPRRQRREAAVRHRCAGC